MGKRRQDERERVVSAVTIRGTQTETPGRPGRHRRPRDPQDSPQMEAKQVGRGGVLTLHPLSLKGFSSVQLLSRI